MDTRQREALVRHWRKRRTDIVAEWTRNQFAPDRLDRYDVTRSPDTSVSELARCFVGPLFDLLLAHVETGEPRYRQVYLDERLRYAPHRASTAVRVAFFHEVLPGDEAALAAGLHDEALQSALRGMLATLHAPLRCAPEATEIRLLALGDCLMNEVRVFLADECRAANVPLHFTAAYLAGGMWSEDGASDIHRILEAHPADVIAVSFLTFDGIPPYVSLRSASSRASGAERDQRIHALVGMMRRFIETIRERTDAPILLHNASGLPLERARRLVPLLPAHSRAERRMLDALNAAVGELAAHTPNVILVDEAAIVQRHGPRRAAHAVIPRRLARGALFHTSRLGALLAPTYASVLRAYHVLRRAKVLALDFDGTLWHGVMADGRVEQRHDVQALLRRLREHGVILVAVSKNDPANIRWNEMTLQPDDFAFLGINWELKVRSIRAAATALGIGLDAFVLIDDNPTERAIVTSQLPMVHAMDAGADATWAALQHMLAFPNTNPTEEARTRTEMYRQQAQRREAMSAEFDYPSIMASLGLVATCRPATRADLDRIAELVQRTNQFNTTTIRYTRQRLAEMLADPEHWIHVVRLEDRFGDMGVVGVTIVKSRDGAAVIDSFVMSCRAMGFELERLMVASVVQRHGDAKVIGRFVPSGRNAPAATLFPGNGFVQHDATEWVLDPRAPHPRVPAWFTVREG